MTHQKSVEASCWCRCWWWRGANGATHQPHFALYSAAARVPASPGATDRRYEAPRPGGAGIWRRNAPATRRWRDTAWTRVNCCSSLRGHRNSSVASQILQQLLANRASNEGYPKVREDFTIRRRPLPGPSPGLKLLLALSHLRHYAKLTLTPL